MSQHEPDTEAMLSKPTMSAAVLLLCVIIASILGFLARGDHSVPGDVAVLEAIQEIDVPGIETIVRVSNTVFATGGALVLGVLFMLVALLMHRPIFVLQLVVVIAIRLAGLTLKPIFDSPRPELEYQPDPSLVSESLGYPSGHAFTATIITTMVVLFVLSLGVSPRPRAAAIMVAVCFTTLAMFSRIWIGAHWPSDTIGGVLYGIAAVALMHIIVTFIRPRFRLRPSTPA